MIIDRADNPITQLREVKRHIEKLQQASPLAAPFINLIAVTKGQEASRIEALLEGGHRSFGENRLQEAQAKWPDLKSRYPDVELHFIGTLQTNKVKEALLLFDAIHTIDRPKLVEALARELEKQKTTQCRKFFIQVNTGEESQKGGVSPGDVYGLLKYCQQKALVIAGLMCVPPADEPPAPHFALLHKMAHAMSLAELSMGMSADYETAIRVGATHVRLGAALFGKRK